MEELFDRQQIALQGKKNTGYSRALLTSWRKATASIKDWMVSSDLFKSETWHTFLAQGLMGTGSKLPRKVMDFLTSNYSNELLKCFWKICFRQTWTSCALYKDKCVTEGQRKQEVMSVAFGPWTQPPRLKLLHALRGPGFPLRGRRQIFLDSKSDLGACFCPIQGGSDDSVPGLTSVLEDLREQCRRQETLLSDCILSICRNASSITLPF